MKFLFVVLVGVGVPFFTFAHSWGTSYTVEDNGYELDIGYSTPAPEAFESVIFDFEILKDQERFRDFSDVWVRIEGQNGTVFASGIHNAEFGGARMSYVFPDPGDYTIKARYQKEDDSIATAEFPITVVGSSSGGGAKNSSSGMLWAVLGLVIGFILSSAVLKKRF